MTLPSGDSTNGTNSNTGAEAQIGMWALSSTAWWNVFIQAEKISGCGAF